MDLDYWDCFGREKLHLTAKKIQYLELSDKAVLLQPMQGYPVHTEI